MKTKKLFLLLFVLSAVLFAASCNGENNSSAHEHDFYTIEAVAATCTKGGNVAYQHCSGCDKNFDAEGNELETVVIEALGHTEEKVEGKAATCTEPGLTDGKKCSVCEAELVKQEVIPAGHKEETVAGKAATCTEPGLTDGKKCSVCGETTVEQEVIPAAHTEEVVPGKAATCTEPGLTDGKKCSACGETIVGQEEIPAGHTLEKVAAVDATCTKEGNVAHEHCSVCEKNFNSEGVELETVVIELLEHTEETVEGKAATCTEPGLTDGKKCSACGETIVEQEEIPAGHKEEVVPGKAATCTEPGLTDGKKCSVCGETIVEQEEITVDHEYNESAWGYKEADGHAHLCKHCDAHDEIVTHTSRENLPVLEEDACTVCGYVINPAQVTLESLFSAEVLENKYVFNMTQHDVTIDFYAVKDDERVYFIANYYTKTPDTDGSWWEQDNFELRLNTPSGYVLNGKPFDPGFFGSDKQWFISVNNESNFEYFSISQPIDSDREGYKVIEFVAYLSFAKLGIESDTPLGFTIGSNPGGKGFIGSENWESVNLLKLKKITTKGILDYCIPENCAHVYGDYVITTPATCEEDGMKEATCPYCQHVDRVVIPATGEHVYDLSNAEVITPSTCSINGVAIAKCGCGDEKQVELDFDLTNHGDHWNSETNICACGSRVNNLVADLSDEYGTYSFIRYEFDMSKDLEFNALIKSERTEHSKEWGHGFVGEVYSENWHAGGWSYRTDWCGWGQLWPNDGKATYTDINNGIWCENYDKASANMDIIYNLKYSASEGKIEITMKYISNVEPYNSEVKYLTYTCSNITYKGKAYVGLGSFKAKVTFQYINYSQGAEVYGPILNGEMDEAFWTEDAKVNKMTLCKGDEVIVDVYATRTDEGVYFYGDYKAKTTLIPSGAWWQSHNLEMRLVNSAGHIPTHTNSPWMVSSTGETSFDKLYISPTTQEGDYNCIKFEFFVSYERLGITKDTQLGVTIGMNPCGTQWTPQVNIDSTDLNIISNITENGLVNIPDHQR